MAKLYVFAAAIRAGLVGLVVIGVLTTLISVYYYLRITVMMFMHPPKDWAEPLPISGTAAIALVITVVITLLLGVYPGPLFSLSQALVR
jgi:NADH-quinone oxidoreductase subunit N